MKITLPRVDYQDSGQHLDQMLEAISQGGAVILQGLPQAYLDASDKLFSYGNMTFNALERGQISEANRPKQSPKNGESDLIARRGYAEAFWGNRLITNSFTCCHFTSDNRYDGGVMQTVASLRPGLSIEEVESDFVAHREFSQALFIQLLTKIEKKLSLQPNELTKQHTQPGYTNLTRRIPVTQTQIKEVAALDGLLVDEQNPTTIIALIDHVDLETLSFLHYQGGNAEGLQFKHEGVWKAVDTSDVVGPFLVVFGGRKLQLMTNGHIEPTEHRVVITPAIAARQARLSPESIRQNLIYFSQCAAPIIEPAIRQDDGLPIEPPSGVSSPFDAFLTPDEPKKLLNDDMVAIHFGGVASRRQERCITDEGNIHRLLANYPLSSLYNQTLLSDAKIASGSLSKVMAVSSADAVSKDNFLISPKEGECQSSSQYKK